MSEYCTHSPSDNAEVPKIDEVFESENKAHIFPNPSTGIFTIEIKDDTINDISVFNSSGKRVYIDANIERSDHYCLLKFLTFKI